MVDYNIILNNKYILNPIYILRNDISRIILVEHGDKDFESNFNKSLITFIHPVFAIMLSFFNGDKNLRDNLLEISKYFDISFDESFRIVRKFIENSNVIGVEYDNEFFYFPDKILIKYDGKYKIRRYHFDDFIVKGKVDIENKRLNIPYEFNLLINNVCVTNCIYCYADKRNSYNCTIPLDRLKEIIQDARSIGVEGFDIQGGELFLYKHWYELLQEVFHAGYNVYLSTKVPIKEPDIEKLVKLGVKKIQISLDSIYAEDLQRNLQVGQNYASQILNTVKLLDKSGIEMKINAVVTNVIYDQDRLNDFIEYLEQYSSIKVVQIVAPAHSTYKTQQEFLGYRLRESQISEIRQLIIRKKEQCHFKLYFDGSKQRDISILSSEERNQIFCKRSRCTGNQSSFTILPNGDVTICEETYFNRNLIIGNILCNSIMDVWNSKRAKELFYISQSVFPKDSPCARCIEFKECRYDLGVCWSSVIAAYGEEKWLYPAPICPRAPIPENIIST